MKYFRLLISLVIITIIIGNVQAQAISYQYGLGGEFRNSPRKALKINDSQTILAGTSNSHESGTHQSSAYGFDDYWVVCLNNGQVVWEKAYGGDYYESLSNVLLLSDGNILLSGYSRSDISGVKTEASRGDADLWIVKTDTSGTILWEKTIGGDFFDSPTKLIELNDGRILILCTSNSSISGEKTLAPKYNSAGIYSDIWGVIIASTSGNVQDQFLIGGNKDEHVVDAMINEDSKLVLVADSYGEASGDKTLDSIGGADIWIVEYNLNTKQIVNQQLYGGTSDDYVSALLKVDDEYILTGMSTSGISGNKTTSSFGQSDIWVIKVNQNLDLIDQASFGGLGVDVTTLSNAVFRSLNHQIIIAAGSNSPSGNGGTKTSPHYGDIDGYVLGINAETLEQRWDFSLGGTEDDFARTVMIDKNEEISVLCYSQSGQNGNKSVPLIGETDYWFVQLGNTTGVEDLNFDLEKVLVYPNPSRGYIYIQNAKLNSNYSVFDVTGQLIQQGIISSNNQEVELQTSTVGILFIQLENTAGGFQTLKLVRD